jgi:hypothetical protein
MLKINILVWSSIFIVSNSDALEYYCWLEGSWSSLERPCYYDICISAALEELGSRVVLFNLNKLNTSSEGRLDDQVANRHPVENA